LYAKLEQESKRSWLVIVEDDDGTEIASVCIDRVPKGTRVEVWDDHDQLVGQLLARHEIAS
jgi:hypothetical protein